MKTIKQFADSVAEQRSQEKMQETGQGPENEGKKVENFEVKEKRGMADLCPANEVTSLWNSPPTRIPMPRKARNPQSRKGRDRGGSTGTLEAT